ncbi:putative 5xTM membrane YitT family protein [Maritalea mobilis]|uniref:Putative 5xTM membrane YitT family protein n=1 Tax=Maritalea mobilis TaxID=483324 RepID=A0A4R6VW20_9HYPH|nr:YitT family protein [Maritalea mobilis]TDQ66996.1 putative 5xTM membrane YitT family protein [Maritalea mobilis]
MAKAQETDTQHKWHEDIQALVLGTLLVALGVSMYKAAMLGTGGINGLALLLSYTSPFEFGMLFFVLNLPFYWLAYKRLGVAFTIKTFAAVGLVSLFAQLTPQWISFDMLHPVYASLVGGGIIGVGLLILFRHKSGLGGVNILAVYLQDRYGIRAGYLQMGVDAAILCGSFFVLSWQQVALSIMGAVVLNLVIATNFRPGRYVGFSGAFFAQSKDDKTD